MFFFQIVHGRPAGRLQFSGGGLVITWLASLAFNKVQKLNYEQDTTCNKAVKVKGAEVISVQNATCHGRSQSSGIGNAPSQAPMTAAAQLMKQLHSTVAFRLHAKQFIQQWTKIYCTLSVHI